MRFTSNLGNQTANRASHQTGFKAGGWIGLAIAGSVWLTGQSVMAQVITPETLPPLIPSEGGAGDLGGTFAKDSAIWLGGVGGEGDIEATSDEDNPYEIRIDASSNPQAIQSVTPAPNRETPYPQRIPLGQF